MNRKHRLLPAVEALQAARSKSTQAGDPDILVDDLDALSLMCVALSDIALNIADAFTWSMNTQGKPYRLHPELAQDLKIVCGKFARLSNNLDGMAGDARRIKTAVNKAREHEGT